jgi:hypothetical protein
LLGRGRRYKGRLKSRQEAGAVVAGVTVVAVVAVVAVVGGVRSVGGQGVQECMSATKYRH